ncbi:WD40/YVTN repeat-like-containing domain superfamily [Sesbania bispinosa]|nr:WD40/YVTN repeat-like-containing domain superfamily [Sesbania bispinosa]
MEKFLVPHKPSIEKVQPLRRCRWKRCSVELNGRFEPNYRHEMMDLLTRSYSEVGAFPHLYLMNGVPCQTHMNRIHGEASRDGHLPLYRKRGVSAVDFDNKGIYLASVTKSGCLMVHDFEALYCHTHELTRLKEDESKHLLHLSPNKQLDAVKWNPLNQDEVFCASVKHNELLIFDVAYVLSEPIEVLTTRHTATVHGSSIHKGLCDVAFALNDSRIFASDTHGTINVWDRRVKTSPCLELTSSSCCALNSIQLDAENQIIFGAGKHGIVYLWDIRGGRASATFQSHKELCHPPLTSVKLATLLEKIGSLKAQADIVPKEIHSIGLNPSCPYQLAFHLDDGWSGILDINNFQVTHIHCPPPAWLNDSYIPADLSYLRKPSWLSTCSIYLAGSPSNCGIHLLDFYPSTSSPSHVDYKEDAQEFCGRNNQNNQNRFIPLSEGVISCAAHPLYNAIVAGTKETSLLVISHRRESCRGED